MSKTMTVDAMEHDREAREALRDLVQIIEAAGLHNLSRGVQLGQTVWFVKASDRLAYAKRVLGGQISDFDCARALYLDELEMAGAGGMK